MKWFTGLALVIIPLLVDKVTASLNCTVINGPILYYTCPDDKCAVAGQYNVGQIAELGCAADSSPPAPNRWFYNWNGYYTKQQPNNYSNCKLGGTVYPSVDVLPLCKDDPYVPTPPPCVCNPTTGLPGTTSTSPATTQPTTTRTTTTSPAPQPTGGNIAKYGQCGGQGWQGSGTCASGSTCKKLNDWYSQCL